MEKIRYTLTDWIFFFNNKNKNDFDNLLNNANNKDIKEELITWKLITVVLPIITFTVVFFLNLITSKENFSTFFLFANNGSLPIISFGIITSGMPFLLEKLEEFPELHTIRRRVMAVALFFLFLSASLYIIQTLHIINNHINCIANLIILIASIYVFLFSKSIGVKMFMLQSKNIQPFEDNVKDGVRGLKDALDDLD